MLVTYAGDVHAPFDRDHWINVHFPLVRESWRLMASSVPPASSRKRMAPG